MPEFAYTARKLDGHTVQGFLEAATRNEALSMLSQKALFPLDVRVRGSSLERWINQWTSRRRIRAEQVAQALSQLSDLLHNGVALLNALDLLASQSPNPALGEIMQDIRDRVAEGSTLEEAMAAHPRVFSDLTVSMVRAGSEGAFLEEALQRIASFLELQEELKSKVKGAMAYPTFLMIGGIAVTILLVVFFVPKFEGLFVRLERQGTGLPMATHMLLWISDFLVHWGVFLLGGLFALGVGLKQVLATPRGKYFTDRLKLRIPLVGKIIHDMSISRFCRVLGTLLRNDVPILKSLRISSGSVGNRLLADAIRNSADNISSGQSLSAPLAQSGLIPSATMAMIRVAEESNSLDTVLVNVADNTDKRVERQLTLMVRFIEPVMLVVIGMAILFVLVALLLPVFDMSTAI